VQHAQQVRHCIVAVIRVDSVRSRQLRPPAQCVVAEGELPGQRVGQRRQPVQGVVLIRVGRVVGRDQPRPVRGRVVAVAVLEIVPRQERVLCARPDQPPHVVVGEHIRPRRIGHLLNPAHQIVHVVRRRRIRIGLAAQPVQRVIDILNGLVLAVRLRGQVAHAVVAVGFVQRRWKGGLRHTAEGVVGEVSVVVVGVGDAGQVALVVDGGWPALSLQVVRAGAPSLSLCSLEGQGGDFGFGPILSEGDQIPRPVAENATRTGHPRDSISKPHLLPQYSAGCVSQGVEVQRSFVARPSPCEGMGCLRMTVEEAQNARRTGHPPFVHKKRVGHPYADLALPHGGGF
jgi:hypothetical protein